LDGNGLDLDLHLPSDPAVDNKVELLSPEIHAKVSDRKSNRVRTHKLKKNHHGSFKLKKSSSTLRQEKFDINNHNLLKAAPEEPFLNLPPKFPGQTHRGTFLPTTYFHKLKQIASLRSERDTTSDSHELPTKSRRMIFPCLNPRNFF
jgi:hypothetical protein